jgi:hypothetical protein
MKAGSAMHLPEVKEQAVDYRKEEESGYGYRQNRSDY